MNNTKQCLNCKHYIDDVFEFCPKCGASQENSAKTTTEEIFQEEKKIKDGMKITVFLFIILMLTVGLINLFSIKKYNDLKTSSVALPQQTTLTTPIPTVIPTLEPTEKPKPTEKINNPTITLEEFNKLKTGMTHKQVANIVGSNGQLLSESDIAGYHSYMIMWEGEESLGANANALFQNGKLVSKSQFGLR